MRSKENFGLWKKDLKDKGYKVWLCKMTKFWDLMYSRVTVVNNTVLFH